jgi:hypothetical protein
VDYKREELLFLYSMPVLGFTRFYIQKKQLHYATGLIKNRQRIVGRVIINVKNYMFIFLMLVVNFSFFNYRFLQ